MVGPAAVPVAQRGPVDPGRFVVRPGLYSLGHASTVVGSSFDESGADRAFLEGRRSYAGLLLRTGIARLLAGPKLPSHPTS